MPYESPVLEVIGTARALIQNSAFGGLDGGPIGHNHLPVHTDLEPDPVDPDVEVA